MKPSSALAAAAACAVSLTPPTAAQRVVPIGIKRTGQKSLPVNKRTTFTQSLYNNVTGAGYYANVAIGTPPQNLTLILDTGSSDIWLLSKDANLCASESSQLKYGYCLATYEPSASSTYHEVSNNTFNIEYVDQTGAQGDYIKDDFYVGGATITQLQMGLAIKSTIPAGIMGIGFESNEAAKTQYPNIMEVFVDQGLIGSKAYSLYLNDYDTSTGTILFGGIDTKKFIGQLTSISLIADSTTDKVTSFTVPLNAVSMSVNGSPGNASLDDAIPVVLDSGTTLTYLPSQTIEGVYNSLGVQYDEQMGFAYIECNYLSQNLTFAFQLGGSDGPTISVPADELVFDNVQELEDAGVDTPSSLDNACTFGILPSDDYYLLGDTFLRSAYVVYDLQNNQVAIAQSNLNSTESNIVEISNSTTELPDVTGVASQVSVTQTATGLPGVGGGQTSGTGTVLPTVTVTASGTSTPSSSPNAGAKNVPAPDWSAVLVMGLTGLGVLVGGMAVTI
ncbi:putative Aspartic peptidase domain-containing protein [Seiridium cardinale]